MSAHDYLRDRFTGGCRRGMPIAQLIENNNGAAELVSVPLRTLEEARADLAEKRGREHAQRARIA